MPYIYSMAGAVHSGLHHHEKPSLFDFPEDKEARKVENEFMFRPVTSHLCCHRADVLQMESTELESDKT